MNVCLLTPPETYHQLAQGVEHGILEAFSSMFEDVAACGEDQQNGTGCDAIVSLISFIGQVSWSLAIAFPRATALAMAHKLVGADVSFESADMIDLAGELINIVAGPTSAYLIARGFDAKMGLPSVARGNSVEVVLPDHMAYRLHFISKQGPFRAKIVAARQA